MTESIKKISSEDLLQELIDRKVLTQIPVGLYKEFELKRKFQNRDKPIDYDGVFLLNSSEKEFMQKQELVKCPYCSQYTHKGNFCEQCGHKNLEEHKC